MSLAALMFGLVGGWLGLFCGGAALTIGYTGSDVLAQGSQLLIGRGCIAFLLSIMAMAGWGLAFLRPVLGGWMMMAVGAGGMVAVFPLYLVPGALLILAGILFLEVRQPISVPARVVPKEPPTLRVA